MSLSGWNYWDIFFIILGCYFIIRGSFRGFVGEVITLVGFLASFYLSFHYSGGIYRSEDTYLKPEDLQLLYAVLYYQSNLHEPCKDKHCSPGSL